MTDDSLIQLWAPSAKHVELCTFGIWNPGENASLQLSDQPRQRLAMTSASLGNHQIQIDAQENTLYAFSLDGGPPLPDPRSQFQPFGVHGPSMLVNQGSYAWQAKRWTGCDPDDLAIYELHIGTFTPQGTYAAAQSHLPRLAQLGVNAIELMPLGQSAGRWNWGYDAVNLHAPSAAYGTPDQLKSFIDAAHDHDIAVIHDVVYNHFGPEGNYLREFGPYFSARHKTPWGPAPNFDRRQSAAVRQYVCDNVRMWLHDYRFDGLRIDAIEFMCDESPRHIVADMMDTARSVQRESGHRKLMIAETNVYNPDFISAADGTPETGMDLIWCDDVLHAIGKTITNVDRIPQRSYDGFESLVQVLSDGALYQGPVGSRQRLEKPLDPSHLQRLVCCIQNHDFVGNQPDGTRLVQQAGFETAGVAAGLMLLLPSIPMLFMGEEVAAESPFYFFVDYGDDHLRRAVNRGRRAEYPQYDWSKTVRATDVDAFQHSNLDWETINASSRSNEMRDHYQSLLRIRRQWRRSGHLSSQAPQLISDSKAQSLLLSYDLPPQSTASTSGVETSHNWQSNQVWLACRFDTSTTTTKPPPVSPPKISVTDPTQILLTFGNVKIDPENQYHLEPASLLVGHGPYHSFQ
ncbi:MAG: alpha-amylase family glycosyl hydrolase [Planctomycetota bacterium]